MNNSIDLKNCIGKLVKYTPDDADFWDKDSQPFMLILPPGFPTEMGVGYVSENENMTVTTDILDYLRTKETTNFADGRAGRVYHFYVNKDDLELVTPEDLTKLRIFRQAALDDELNGLARVLS